jgi:hypothetical protein
MNRKIYILQKFITGSLSEEEKKEFQDYMLSDESFRRKMIRAVDIDNSLDDWLKIGPGSDMQTTLPLYKKPVFYKSAMAMAAVLCIGIILTVLFRPVSVNKLYKSAYQPMVFEEFRSPSSENLNTEILENYQNENYAAIYALISTPEKLPELDDLSILLTGISCIEEGDPILAEKQLNRIPPESKYRADAAWYLALLNLKQNKIDTSLQYLKEADKSIVYLDKVRQLREKIVSIR